MQPPSGPHLTIYDWAGFAGLQTSAIRELLAEIDRLSVYERGWESMALRCLGQQADTHAAAGDGR
jgi:hypothetical protein